VFLGGRLPFAAKTSRDAVKWQIVPCLKECMFLNAINCLGLRFVFVPFPSIAPSFKQSSFH
jgi:hypothetical protein